jgi:hypothetical protein
MSNTSARRLIDELCGDRDLKLLALHDFDKSGLSILATLREDTRRYTFTNDVERTFSRSGLYSNRRVYTAIAQRSWKRLNCGF